MEHRETLLASRMGTRTRACQVSRHGACPMRRTMRGWDATWGAAVAMVRTLPALMDPDSAFCDTTGVGSVTKRLLGVPVPRTYACKTQGKVALWPRVPSRGAGRARCGMLWRGCGRAWAWEQRVVLVHSSRLSPASQRSDRCAKLATNFMSRCAPLRLRSRGLLATFLLRFLQHLFL